MIVDQDTWSDFLQYRKEIGKPMTETGQRRMLKRLQRLDAEGYDPEAILEFAMSEGWRGVWPDESCRREKQTAVGPAPSRTMQGVIALENYKR